MNEPNTFSKLEADRILKRAGEIEGSEASRSLSVADIRSIATEAGFGAHAVEQAIAEARQAMAPGVHRPPVRRSGFIITQLSTMRTIPVDVGTEGLMRAVRLFQPYREGPAQVKLEEHEITWRDRRGIRFTLTASPGSVEIRVYVSKFLLRRGRWMGWVNAAADRLETLAVMVGSQA